MSRVFAALLSTLLFAALGLPTHAQTVAYTDKLGRRVDLPATVHRAVIMQLYEFLPSLRCWDRVAGVGRYAYENDLMLEARPNIQKQIPSVGSGTDLNTEALLKLKPDLVITWTFKPENVKFMQDRGIKVIAVNPDSLPELYDLIRLQGRLFQREAQAKNTITQMNEVFRLVQARSAKIPWNQRKKVLWIGGRPNNVAGASGLTDNMLNLIGGRNVAGGIKQRNADVSVETIIGWNPEVIFIWGNAKYVAQDIMSSPQWRHVKAVREGKIFKAPEWSTWSPRLAPVVLWMATKTYPDLYRDINLHSATSNFYQKVFGMPMGKAATSEF